LQVLESRVDHTRVVLMLRKAGNLPLVKDYLMSVQKTNLSAVNEAVNELLIEEEDFEVRPHSIVSLARCSGVCSLVGSLVVCRVLVTLASACPTRAVGPHLPCRAASALS